MGGSFEVAAFPHPGLGLNIGKTFTKAHLEQKCMGYAEKLKQLAIKLNDSSFLLLARSVWRLAVEAGHVGGVSVQPVLLGCGHC